MKTTLVIFLFLLLPFHSDSQVYMVGHLGRKLIIGPDNTSETNLSIYAYHMKELKDSRRRLQKLLAQNISIIKKHKKDKYITNRTEKNMETIHKEIAALDFFEEKWKEAMKKETLKFTFYKEWVKDSCIIIKSKSKKYFPGEYDVRLSVNEDEKSYTEFFPIVIIPELKTIIKEWIENCTSKVPSECYTNKTVTIPSGIFLKLYNDSELRLATCPVGFSYSEDKMSCLKVSNYYDKNTYVEIIDKQTKEVISISNWKKKKCK